MLPADDGSPHHFQEDIFKVLAESDEWDLGVFHPPCTYLTVAGARWLYHPDDKDLAVARRRPHPAYPNRHRDRDEAVIFAKRLSRHRACKRSVTENPVGYLSTVWRKPDQIIQPWMFGHGEPKATCLWLRGVPKLKPTNIVDGREGRIWKLPPSEDRWKLRSETYQGIADAMAEQYGQAINGAS